VVGRSCRTPGPSGGLTAAAARGAALNGRADALYVVNDALGSFLLRANEVIDQVPMSACGHETDQSTRSDDVRSSGAGSTGRRNTSVKSLCWGFKLQGLTWSFV
jgi:hypothetical protein